MVRRLPRHGPEIREAQAKVVQNSPNCGLAIAIDIGEAKNIHPRNKQELARRLALIARKDVYGGEDLICSGPVFRKMARTGNRLVLQFDHAEGGFVVKGEAIKHFSIAGADRKFVWASAVINSNTVEVWSDGIAEPPGCAVCLGRQS